MSAYHFESHEVSWHRHLLTVAIVPPFLVALFVSAILTSPAFGAPRFDAPPLLSQIFSLNQRIHGKRVFCQVSRNGRSVRPIVFERSRGSKRSRWISLSQLLSAAVAKKRKSLIKRSTLGCLALMAGEREQPAPTPNPEIPLPPETSVPPEDSASPTPLPPEPTPTSPPTAPTQTPTSVPPTPIPTPTTCEAVSQYGITWTFDSPRRCGQYITGDWWVVGPVTIQAVSPQPTGGGPTFRHGSMLNPDLSRDPALEQSTYQGYDGRADGYNPSVTVSYPLTLDPSDGIKSLVSTESILSFPYNPALDDDTLHQPYTYKVVERADIGGQGILRTAAILTVVNSPPEQGSFRPPFVGVTKPTFSSQNLRTDLLPAFEPVGEVPSLSALTRLVQRPWISVQKRNYMSAGIEPVNNGIAYGRDVATVLGDAALALCSNFPLEEKRPILHGLVQMGIDTFYAVQLDSMLFENSGGYRVGRKFQVLLAGLMLNNQELLHVAGIFQEDQATYYGGDALSGEVLWTGWSSQPKPFSDILSNNVMYGTSRNWQFPGSLGNHEEHPLDQWAQVMHGNDHPWNRAEGYRRLVSWSLPGQALSALLLGLKPYWNHPAYFDYVDRWMNEDDAASRQALASAALTYGWNSIDQEADWTDPEIYRPHGRLCISNFAEAMYRRYRGYASGDPQASFTVTPRRGRAPLVTQFDASSSTQFRGSITQYSWQFGDGATASGRNVAHTYTQNGNYTATLTVIDDSTPPRVAQTTRQILVNDAVEPSLIFYLPFDNDFADRSGEDHQVSCLRDCFGHMSGRIGQAAIFGGEPFGSSRGDVYVSPSSTDLQGMSELTVAFWAKKASPTIGNASEALKKGGSYQVRVQDGAVTAILSNSSSTSFVTVPVQNLDSDWHHYAFAANGTTVRFYFDGLEVPDSARAFQSPIGIDTTRDLVIGGDGSGASFNGALDDFRIYNRALAAGEIGQLAAP